MKFIVMIKAASGTERSALDDWLLGTGAPMLAQAAKHCVLNLVQPAADPARFDAVIEIWTETPSALSALLTPDWTARTQVASYEVSEQIEKDTLGMAPGHPSPVVKMIAGWTRHAHVSPLEARRHWDEHVPLANRIHVGCERYVRHWVEGIATTHADEVQPYQGIAFQYYRTLQDMEQRTFDKPESVKLIMDDVADFLLNADVLRVAEYLIKN